MCPILNGGTARPPAGREAAGCTPGPARASWAARRTRRGRRAPGTAGVPAAPGAAGAPPPGPACPASAARRHRPAARPSLHKDRSHSPGEGVWLSQGGVQGFTFTLCPPPLPDFLDVSGCFLDAVGECPLRVLGLGQCCVAERETGYKVYQRNLPTGPTPRYLFCGQTDGPRTSPATRPVSPPHAIRQETGTSIRRRPLAPAGRGRWLFSFGQTVGAKRRIETADSNTRRTICFRAPENGGGDFGSKHL